jgi:hypothetical protein
VPWKDWVLLIGALHNAFENMSEPLEKAKISVQGKVAINPQSSLSHSIFLTILIVIAQKVGIPR